MKKSQDFFAAVLPKIFNDKYFLLRSTPNRKFGVSELKTASSCCFPKKACFFVVLPLLSRPKRRKGGGTKIFDFGEWSVKKRSFFFNK